MQWRHWVVGLSLVKLCAWRLLSTCSEMVQEVQQNFTPPLVISSIYAVYGLLEWFAVTPSSEMSFQNDIIIYHHVPKIHRWSQRPLQILPSRRPLVHLQHFSLMSSKQNKTNRPWHTAHNSPSGLAWPSKSCKLSSHGRVNCTGVFVGWFNQPQSFLHRP